MPAQNKKPISDDELLIVARSTGFEPAISSVTGRRDGPASLRAHVYLEYSTSFTIDYQQGRSVLYLG